MKKAKQAETFYNQNNLREFYCVKCMVLEQKAHIKFVQKNGTLLTTDKEISDRWIEHFSDL